MLKTGAEKLLRKNPGISLLRSATSTHTNSTKLCQNKAGESNFIQVTLCQKLLFLHQLTHNMPTDCSLNYQFSTWKFQAQNMGRTWEEHENMLCTKIVFCFCFDIQNNICAQHVLPVLIQCSLHVLSLEFSCTELVIQWTICCHIVG